MRLMWIREYLDITYILTPWKLAIPEVDSYLISKKLANLHFSIIENSDFNTDGIRESSSTLFDSPGFVGERRGSDMRSFKIT